MMKQILFFLYLGMIFCVFSFAQTFAQAQNFSESLKICRNPTSAQEHTLKALASTIKQEYSRKNCKALYLALGKVTNLKLVKKRFAIYLLCKT